MKKIGSKKLTHQAEMFFKKSWNGFKFSIHFGHLRHNPKELPTKGKISAEEQQGLIFRSNSLLYIYFPECGSDREKNGSENKPTVNDHRQTRGTLMVYHQIVSCFQHVEARQFWATKLQNLQLQKPLLSSCRLAVTESPHYFLVHSSPFWSPENRVIWFWLFEAWFPEAYRTWRLCGPLQNQFFVCFLNPENFTNHIQENKCDSWNFVPGGSVGIWQNRSSFPKSSKEISGQFFPQCAIVSKNFDSKANGRGEVKCTKIHHLLSHVTVGLHFVWS